MAVLVRRYYVRPRPHRATGWCATQVLEIDGKEDTGCSSEFKTKKEAKAYADIKNEELVVEGTYRRGL